MATIGRLTTLLLAFLLATPAAADPAANLVTDRPARGALAIAANGSAAHVLYDPADHAVVVHAANGLARDITAVTGIATAAAAASSPPPAGTTPPIILGTLGRNALIDRLVRTGQLDARRLTGAWESFVIAVVRRPAPGVPVALVIAGSDRRGTAFGAYELSEAIGVSPWHWWADVPARRRAALYVAPGTHRFGPPSVRSRGIFLNDEDWGLHPWAARTFEPEHGGIGARTYERLFDLMLRLKANTLWPAMHHVSAPFNRDPAHAKLADEYAIVMGSSHAEPMLRDNVGEWTDAPDRFNYATNRAGVSRYWEERVRTNARFESLWTLGMRGIHDSGIVGADTTDGKIALLSQVFADQRAMLATHVSPAVERVPQMFVPYKEVLDLYRAGLKVPGDVTLVWPDDNFGYIRQFPDASERQRPGGSGVYYHLSYLGAPLSYLWLGTTPPALIRSEMGRAWDHGARTIWIANVGDVKPAEIGITAFLAMAWNVDAARAQSQRDFLADWAGRSFGPAVAAPIADLMDRWYRLNLERRPEHLHYGQPGQRPRPSLLAPAAIDARLATFDALVADVDRIEPGIAADARDAFFELVAYPVRAAAAANRRYFSAERYAAWADGRPRDARRAAADAIAADAVVKALTRRFNEDIAGGKWRHIIAEEPADNQWPGYRLPPVALPAPGLADASVPAPPPTRAATTLVVEAESVAAKGWRLVPGLGRGGGAMLATGDGASIGYTFDTTRPGTLAVQLVPTFPGTARTDFRLTVTLDGTPRTIAVPRRVGDAAWSAGVLDNLLSVAVGPLAPGRHRLTIATPDEGVTLDRLIVTPSPAAAPAPAH
jgi:hypothetical protein